MARNAFAIRTSEQSAPDEVFARYFAPDVLTVLPDNIFASSALVLRSSPGGGKTSLLRMFTPGPMLQVFRNPKIPPHDETFRHLAALGALDQTGIRVMGVLITCTTVYSEIGPPLSETGARGLLRALVNARVVLRTLRALCALHELDYPGDLARVAIAFEPSLFDEGAVPRTDNAVELRDWAENVETRCFALIDAIVAPSGSDVPTHASFDAIVWLSQASFSVDGTPSTSRAIVMFDDVHRLRAGQRQMLYEELLDHRSGTPVWLAERTEVLDPTQLLTGAVPRRDFCEVQLERAWAVSKGRRFLKFATVIADRRVIQMRDDLESFGDRLVASLSDPASSSRLAEAAAMLRDRAAVSARGTNRYDQWIRAVEADSLSDRMEQAIAWAKVGILVSRDRNRPQRSLDLEPLSDQDLEARDTSGLPQAAEKFVCSEFGLPYFYGIDRVVRLSSYNVEEFLQICAVLYEYLHAAQVMRGPGPISVSAADQDRALRRLGERRFREIPRAFPLGEKAQRLIGAIGRMSHDRTFEPNAPYAPGVTGIGLTVQDREKLVQAARKGSSDPFHELAAILSACVAQNLFEVREHLRQDSKDWTVLYLNRIFCAHFDLVYQTGGWQRVSIRRLREWSEGIYRRSDDRMSLI